MATAEPVVGELYGTRAFGVTTDGALTGYNHTGYTWTPGENIADCRAHTRKKTPPPGHPVPEPACRCGFYAYTTASPRWKSNQISGIIAGHGRTVAGELGFRSHKARIVALCFGPRVPWPVKAAVEKNYPHARVFEDRASMLAEYDVTTAPVPNRFTSHGFTAAGASTRRPQSLSRRAPRTPPKPPTPQALAMLRRGLGAAAFLMLLAGLLATSAPAVSWLVSPLYPPATHWFAEVPRRDPTAVWIAATNSPLVCGPWFLVALCALCLGVKLRDLAPACILPLVGTFISAAPWYELTSTGPSGLGGRMTLASVLWLACVLAAAAAIAYLAWNPQRVAYRREGHGLARRVIRSYSRELGVFTYTPATDPPPLISPKNWPFGYSRFGNRPGSV